ncbi:MAG TPA: quinol:electron acceptor oxidoreductase subunit ActD [Bryobacteraceae bacterium]|nr:quinol:electron acceptor oxidoreductase subunit ActD [Bryobacteraceae bacterium]
MYLNGEFRFGDARERVLRALQELRERGFAARDVDVFSNEPLEIPRDVLERRSHMSFAAVTGAVLFCVLIIGFVSFTQYSYPLITGGMPLFSFWATGVVFYEITMLGAILTTFCWFLKEAGLLRRGRPPAPDVEPGMICIRVRCRIEQSVAAQKSLEAAGATNIQSSGDAR